MAIQVFQATFDVEACLAEIRECLEKGWTGMGFKTVQMEEAWKKYTGFENAYYLNSSTAGLNLCVEILKEKYGWADGDEIITTPLTFISTNHAILLGGMHPVFADVDDTFCMDPKEAEKKITEKTRAIMYVGLGGNVGHWDEIVALAKKHDLKLILDAAHMAGTRVNGVIPGKEADVVVYSFQAVKNLPTADSGMICFREKELDAIARKRAWLGINKDTYARTGAGGNYKWKYDVEYVGRKDHGNSVIASLALVQLRHLDEDNARRREICKQYLNGLSVLGDKVRFANVLHPEECSRHLFQILVEDRDGLMLYLNEHDIFPGVHYVDNTEYRMYRYAHGTCPHAAYISDHTMTLPLHMRLTERDVEAVIQAICDFIQKG